MGAAKRWTVIVDIEHTGGRARAVARLHQRESDRLVAVGAVNLDPVALDVPEIGDDLAAAAALTGLSSDLRRLAAQLTRDAVPAPRVPGPHS
jgi:hypothetical protein